jgi:hypothetical protein
MSYTARAKPKAFATCKEKLARAPVVLEALCKKFGWECRKVGATLLGLVMLGKDSRHAYANVNFNTVTGEFTHDTDYDRELLPQLRKVVNEDGSLSDLYETADIGVANKIKNNWDWRWTGEDSIEIENAEVFA